MLTEKNFVFILTRPNYLGNIGSSARVMKNFGFDRLRLVLPPRNYLDAEARKMAVDAFDVLKKAQVYDSLSSALADVTLAIGSSCGQYRSSTAQSLTVIADQLLGKKCDLDDEQLPLPLDDENTVAIVFGDERNGLTNDEIDRCHRLMRIESNVNFPSLNLSQALGIVAYHLSLKLQSPDNIAIPGKEGKTLLMNGSDEDELMEKIATLMDIAEFSRSFSRDKVLTEFRSTLQRLQLSQREGQIWRGFIVKILNRLSEGQ